MTETCRNCGTPVLVMTQKGTGFCGQICERIDRQYQVDEIERARNEPECSTPDEGTS